MGHVQITQLVLCQYPKFRIKIKQFVTINWIQN